MCGRFSLGHFNIIVHRLLGLQCSFTRHHTCAYRKKVRKTCHKIQEFVMHLVSSMSGSVHPNNYLLILDSGKMSYITRRCIQLSTTGDGKAKKTPNW